MKIDETIYKNYHGKLLIYRIYCIVNNKSYIGKCSQGLNRVREHFRDYKVPKREYRAKMLYRAINKYGEENFKWEVLCVCDSLEELNKKEIEFIKDMNTKDRKMGYNLTSGGTGGNTWSHLTEEERKTASEKLSKSNKKYYAENPERKLAQSETLKRTRKDIEKSSKNSQISSERLKRLSSTDSRFINARCIKVLCIESNVSYDSIKEAAATIGVSPTSLQSAIIKNRKCKGFTFKKI